MTKTNVHQIRLSDQEKLDWKSTAENGGWINIADMIRALVSRAQSQQPLPVIEQRQLAPQPEAPPL